MKGNAAAIFFLASSALWARSQSQMMVAVYNYADVANESIARAKKHAQLIFEHAGVRIHWLDQEQTDTPDYPMVSVRLLRRSAAIAESETVEVMGRAHLDPLAGAMAATMVDAYWSTIDKFAAKYKVDPGELLGAVIAHELGHALLGAGHIHDGLMSSLWNRKRMEELRKRGLRFDSGESLKIARALEVTFPLIAHDSHPASH